MLSPYEQQLVEDHLSVVKDTLAYRININESISGLGYWDLYQTGCLSLCKAASTFRTSHGASFKTYASVVVYHDLMDYCRKICTTQSRLCSLDASVQDMEESTFHELIADTNQADAAYKSELYQVVSCIRQEYKGVSQKGVEALLLKCQGYSGIDIARYYGVKPNHVAAWISRACQKLRADSRILNATAL